MGKDKLSEDNDRLKQALDSMLEGCQIIGRDWRYLYVNDATVRHSRKTKKELLGRTMMEAYPGIEKTAMFAHLRRCMRGRTPILMENEFAFPDGTKGWFELSIQPHPQGIFILSQDVTERKKIDRALRVLGGCNEAVIRAADERDLFRDMCDVLVEKGNYRLAWIGLAQNDKERTVKPAAQAGFEGGYLKKAWITWSNAPGGRGPTGTAIRTGKVFIARDILTNKRFAPWRKAALKRGYASSIALPLVVKRRTIGTLNIYATEPDAFDGEELRLLGELANDVSYGVAALRAGVERKRMATELAVSEKRYSDIFENANDLLHSVDIDGRFIRVNRKWKETLGYTDEDIKELTIWDIIRKDHLPYCRRIFRRITRGETISGIETFFVTKDGREIAVEGNISPHMEKDRFVYTRGVYRDITERKKAEEALKESEARLFDFLESSKDLIQSVSADGRYIYVNKEWKSRLGYSDSEIKQLTMADVIHPAELQHCMGVFEQLLKGKSFANIETRFVAKDGSVIDVNGNVNSWFQDGTFLSTRGIFRDITERKKAEQRLMNLNRMLWTIRGVNQLITRIKDADALLEETCKRLTSIEEYGFAWIGLTDKHGRFTKTYGKGGSREMAKALGSLLDGKGPRCVRRALKKDIVLVKGVTAACSSCPLAKMCRNKSAIAVSLKADGRKYGVLLVNLPLEIASDEDELSLFRELAGDLAYALHSIETEGRRKKAEGASAESGKGFKTIFENVPDGILIADVTDKKFIMANKAIRRMIGYSDDEIRGMGVADIHPKKDLPYVMKQFQRLTKREITSSGDIPVQRKDGSVFYAEVNSFPIMMSGRPFLLGVFRDTTERKRLEQMAKDYAIKLESDVNARTAQLVEEKRKVEALSAMKDEFTRNVTHELKTPLSVILGNLIILRDYAPIGKEKEWVRLLDMLDRNATRLRNDIEQMLQLSRIGAIELKKERVYLHDLVKDAYREHLPLANMKGIVLKLDAEPVIVMGDGEMLRLAINNLLSNAIKFTERGSAELTLKSLDGRVLVRVSDTGIGISQQNRKRLFERFFKANPNAPGTGIGLALTKEIVEKHKGTISVITEPGKGSTFEIMIPRGAK